MSSISRRAARTLIHSVVRPSVVPARHIRNYAKRPEEERPQLSDEKDSPYLVGTPIYPPPRDPFAPAPKPLTDEERAARATKYSETQKSWIKGLAKIMGYNTKAVTAIRETKRMLGGIVEAVERDAEYWYGECQLPPTYQTFFQLHLLYILMLVPRLRALPTSASNHSHPIPEPSEPLPPRNPPEASPSISEETTASSSRSLFAKPVSDRYTAEIINNFFELAESQMRRVLGRGERERVVQKYLRAMGEQYKGASVGLDVILGLGMSKDPAQRAQADAELASWIWRNLFATRGLGPPSPEFVAPDEVDAYNATELYMVEQIDTVVNYVRREMLRLDRISDQDVLDGNIGAWGRIKET